MSITREGLLPPNVDWAWDIARLFPTQGNWSEADYFNLTDQTRGLVEFTDGQIEVLEMPTTSHQQIVLFLLDAIRAFIGPTKLGLALMAPLRVRIREGKYREPDIVFLLAEHQGRAGEDYWEGADLVMEVVSPGKRSRERDLSGKRLDYAEAGIREYWVIDPVEHRVSVLELRDGTYQIHGNYTAGDDALSVLLDGWRLNVDSIFAATR